MKQVAKTKGLREGTSRLGKQAALGTSLSGATSVGMEGARSALGSDEGFDRTQIGIETLSGGVGVIHVGAATELEMKEKKDRVDDALHATRAAVEEGILPGGGVALIRCIPALEALAKKLSEEEKTGVEILIKALTYPLRQIAENAGQEGSIVVQKVIQMKQNEGWDAQNDVYGDMIKAGIVDPTKVARLSIQLAASVAGLLLTTEAIITEEKEEQPAAAAPPGMGGMGY